MAHKDRNKEFWLVPKRANLQQTAALVKGILDLKYNYRTWNPSVQGILGTFLKKLGSTDSGKTITPQAVRTLLASIPQYFGFVLINTQNSTNTLIVTDAGKELYNEFAAFFSSYSCKSLSEAEKKGLDIKFSQIYNNQFAKLQITNPVILKDCQDIYIFPLIFVLKVVKILKYLTYDELAYFIFQVKNPDQLKLVILEIKNFRSLQFSKRKHLIDVFKRTHLGNISLVQAPSTRYFEKLCRYTELFVIDKVVLPNPQNKSSEKASAMFLSPNKTKTIASLIKKYEKNIPYDFKNNLDLWLDYIGNPIVKKTPKDYLIYTSKNEDILITISQNNKIIFTDLINEKNKVFIPVMESYIYKIDIINPKNGSIFYSYKFNSSHNSKIDISKFKRKKIDFGLNDFASDIAKINAHISSQYFDASYSQYLSIIEKISGRVLLENKSLRGAYLEYLFSIILNKMVEKGILDEVKWNGKIGQFGLPSAAPGGQLGEADIIAFKDDIVFVFELTTIKPKAMQWQAEGASVPDHVKIISDRYKGKKIIGFYLAPEIHPRITSGMLSNLSIDNSELRCVRIEDFIKELSLDKKFRFETYFSADTK